VTGDVPREGLTERPWKTTAEGRITRFSLLAVAVVCDTWIGLAHGYASALLFVGAGAIGGGGAGWYSRHKRRKGAS
jgi:hypothetical protein